MSAKVHRYAFDRVICDFRAHTLVRGTQSATLSELSAKLLEALCAADGSVVSYDDLRTHVWGGNQVGEEALKQRIKILRDQIVAVGGADTLIETVRGKGYRLSSSVKPLPDAEARSLLFKVGRSALFLIGSLLVFAFLVGLYENVYTPYRMKNTPVSIQPISYEGAIDSSFVDEFDRQILKAMVDFSGLGVVSGDQPLVADYEIKTELRKDVPNYHGRVFVIRRSDQQVEGLYVFKLRPSIMPAELSGHARLIAEKAAAIIRGFPKPE